MDPVNDIALGPFHTVHSADGSRASDIYWWEPAYVKEKVLFDLAKQVDQLRRGERHLRSLIGKCKFSDFIERALIRYVRALDVPDAKTSFMQLWGVLEYVTLTEKAAYDVTISRALFAFRKKDYYRLILNRLRSERNQLIHEGRDSEQAELSLFNLLLFVNEALTALIYVGHKFQSKAEYGEFLDLPSDPSMLSAREVDLKRKLRSVEHAKKIFVRE
jgi:hypothetical protein